MCAVSVIYDYGRKEPWDHWNWQKLDQFRELVRKAEEYDRLTNQPHCEDPKKATWMKEVEDRLKKLEKRDA